MIEHELVWDDEGMTEYKGVRYKRITVPDAIAVQYDVQLYFFSDKEVWASIIPPEERRQSISYLPEWSAIYWKEPGTSNSCVRVDTPKPEYECEQST